MSLRLKPYPEYEDSGLPWVGRLPRGWSKERAKWLFQRMQRPIRPEDGVVTCFRDGMVTLRSKRRLEGFTESLKEIGYQGVRRGDLVIHAMDAFAGAIGVADSDGKSTPVYSVCAPRKALNVYYYANVVREMARSQWIAALAKGIRERSTDFRYEAFANEWLPFPSVEEQNAIASFIQRIDSKTKKLIRAKRRAIELLNEQRSAFLMRIVERFSLDAPTIPLRHLGTKFGSGVTPRGGAQVYKDSGIPLLRSQNVHFEGLRLDDVAFISDEIHAEMSGTHVKPGDVLLNITGASIGRLCVVPNQIEQANVNQHVCIIRPKQTMISARFLAAVLSSSSFQEQIYLAQNGASREGLPVWKLKAFRIPCPSLEKQEAAIVDLDRVTTPISDALDTAAREIDLFREYRTRLITDVVTGRLDVRGVELPELNEVEENRDVEEDEELDDSEEAAVEENVDAD